MSKNINFKKFTRNANTLELTKRFIDLYNNVNVLNDLINFLYYNPKIVNLSLKNCDISDLQISVISKNNIILSKISSLDLEHNFDLSTYSFNKFITIFSKLEKLNLSYTLIKSEEFFKMYGKLNSFLENLSCLEINGSELGLALTVDFNNYKINENLSFLSLRDNDISDDSLEIIIKFITYFPKLQRLDLSDNVITGEGMQIISQTEILNNITNIKLAGNLLASSSLVYILPKLKCKNITHLNISDNFLNVRGAYLLANYLFESLENLDVSNNQLTDEGGVLIASASWITKLLTLNFNENRLTNLTLSELLLSNQTLALQSISFFNNLIDDEGVRLLTTYWPAKLVELNLGSNEIGINSIIFLAEIVVSTNLKSLNLSNNAINFLASTELIGLLNGGLENLNLRSNYLGVEIIFKLLEAVNYNITNKLSSLNLTNTLKLSYAPPIMCRGYDTKTFTMITEAEDYLAFSPDHINSLAKKSAQKNIKIIIDKVYQPFIDLLSYIYLKAQKKLLVEIEKIEEWLVEINSFKHYEIVHNHLKQLIDDGEISAAVFGEYFNEMKYLIGETNIKFENT